MKRFGLLGEKLSHSYSPQIHALLGNYEYKLYEKKKDELEGFFKDFQLDGINVTIPHKRDVMPFCGEISDTAGRIGSVNTIVRRGGRLEGHNTDYYGFSQMLLRCGAKVSGAKVVILGSGGSALTVSAVASDLGAAEIVVVSRKGKNNYENIRNHANADIIVNTTPVGMHPNNGAAPVSLALFPRCRAVLDLIYNPERTSLLLEAEELEIPHTGGLTMLVAQAFKSARLFVGGDNIDEDICGITKKLRSQMGNIVLIGMPGCGKSTVGKIVAEMTGKAFVDSDEEIEKKERASVTEIINVKGEEYFRNAETLVLAHLEKMSGAVIATGGGCVTKKENYPLLRRNGTIVWLRRDLNLLARTGRPLSQRDGAAALYESRKELYESFADFVVDNNGDVITTAKKITEIFE